MQSASPIVSGVAQNKIAGRTIAFFIPSIEGGGIERNLVNLCRGLLALDYAVDVVYCRATEAFLNQIPANAHMVRIGNWASSGPASRWTRGRTGISLAALPGLLTYLRSTRPFALIAMQSSVFAVWTQRLANRSTTLIVRESNTPTAAIQDSQRASVALLWMKRWSYPSADAVVANSHSAADDLSQVLHVSRHSIEVIYNPSFDPMIKTRSEEPLDHPWFQPGEPPVILGIGRLVPQKDFVSLIQAFACVRVRVAARLVILGEGAQRAELEQLVDNLGVKNDVALLGFVPNPYKYLSRAAVFVLSSRYEGLPNVLIEAVGLGVPSVSFDCPSGPREILLGGNAGILAPLGDVPALAQGIVDLLTNHVLASQLAAVGQAQSWRFTPEMGVNQYVDLIERSSARKQAHKL